ncbi:MAG: hypothetical protein H6613_13785 [Ignavibacteriales bacterium]|nr:hypothetical protein [Ignavibacteriales bacterium]
MKRNINIFFYTALLTAGIFSLFYLSSCDDGPTEPVIEPGSRDYLWVVDTLDAEYNYIYKIWGSSPNSVWAIGDGSSFDKTIWYYDGYQWSTDGLSRNILPRALWGFSKDNVYIGGLDGKIWRYDGQHWSQFTKLETQGTAFITFENIWGTSPNDFFMLLKWPR